MRELLVWERDWLQVRDKFTQAERDALNAARTDALILCPRAGGVDLDKLPRPLEAKLVQHLPFKVVL